LRRFAIVLTPRTQPIKKQGLTPSNHPNPLLEPLPRVGPFHQNHPVRGAVALVANSGKHVFQRSMPEELPPGPTESPALTRKRTLRVDDVWAGEVNSRSCWHSSPGRFPPLSPTISGPRSTTAPNTLCEALHQANTRAQGNSSSAAPRGHPGRLKYSARVCLGRLVSGSDSQPLQRPS